MSKTKNIREHPGFDWVNWSVSDIRKIRKTGLDEKIRILEDIKKIPAKDRNFKNTVVALEESNYKLGDILNQLSFLLHTNPRKEIRDEAEETFEYINNKSIDLEYDEGIYRALKEFQKTNTRLSGADKKLFADMVRGFKRIGFGLSKGKRLKLKSNSKKLNSLSISFEKNISEYKDFILVSEQESAGLPKSFLENRKKKNGKYIVTLEYPDYFPFMEYCLDENKRRELLQKFYKQGGSKNIKLLMKILKLRYKNAKLLGYKNPAEFILEIKMAENVKTVQDFLYRLEKRIKGGVIKDVQKLTKTKREFTKDPKSEFNIYDTAFYSRILKEKTYNLNKEKVREYFPFENVKKGVFEVYSKLLSIDFEQINLPKWHDSVESYIIRDKDGSHISYFFIDLFPRDGKYGHAAAFDIVSGREKEGEYIKPVSALVTNFSKPQNNKPALLTYAEVETFFHEFGHIMHQTLTKARYASQSGTAVPRDFVEAPSQMLENWIWQEKVLNKITSHYKLKKPMPADMIKKIKNSRLFLESYFTARQLAMGVFDMEIHTKYPKKPVNKIYDDIFNNLVKAKMPKGNIFPARFGHFIGYEAGYYGYLWSRVYAADMFSKFKKEGILNAKTGMEYRKKILEKGDSEESMGMIKKFLGRKPNEKAFLKELGL